MIVGSLYMQVGSSTTMLLGTICDSWYIPDILEKFRTGLKGLKLEEMVEKPLLLRTGNLFWNSETSRCEPVVKLEVLPKGEEIKKINALL